MDSMYGFQITYVLLKFLLIFWAQNNSFLLQTLFGTFLIIYLCFSENKSSLWKIPNKWNIYKF